MKMSKSSQILNNQETKTYNDIKINFWDHAGWKWVDADYLISELHQCRQESAKIFLEKFS